MSPAVKPRPAAVLEVTFLAAQCHKGACLQLQAYLGHTQTSLWRGWAWPWLKVCLISQEATGHLSEQLKLLWSALWHP